MAEVGGYVGLWLGVSVLDLYIAAEGAVAEFSRVMQEKS
jgi:hypothetical protein